MDMIMQTVSLWDCVTVRPASAGFAIHTGGDLIPAGKKSLEQRAAESFFAHVGREMPGLCVELEKHTPAYAGLGGGSADVAALLRILRDTYAPDLRDETLEAIGLEIGSDMPFCVRGGTALAQGRGERLTDLPPLPPCWIVLCKPSFGIPTPELFALVDGQKLTRRPDLAGAGRLWSGETWRASGRLCNVFEQVLPPDYQEVFAIRDRMPGGRRPQCRHERLGAHGVRTVPGGGDGPGGGTNDERDLAGDLCCTAGWKALGPERFGNFF